MKGFFTQGVAVLFERAPTVESLELALGDVEILKGVPAGESWELGGEGLLIAHRPEVNGLILIDIAPSRWPDHMGSNDEPILFGAWSMGHFGPFAYPGGLERAGQQAWSWDGAADAVAAHQAFVRVRLSYAFGGDGEAPVMPDDGDPQAELARLHEIATALLGADGALALYNPNGEMLLGPDVLRSLLEHAADDDIPPLDVWSNVRLFKLGEFGWSLMDSVGMWQLDVPDHEACFAGESHDPNEVACFLRNAALYVLQEGEVIDDGDSMDGPGDIRWRARSYEDGLVQPPRRTLRWFPSEGPEPPAELTTVPS